MPRKQAPRPQRTILRARELFVEALAKGLSVTGAANAAGIPRRTIYEWREANEDFKAAWDDALEQGTDIMEDEARRRAIEGYDRAVYQGGQLVGHVREYSDTLHCLLLKSRRPGKYRDQSDINHTGDQTLTIRGGLPDNYLNKLKK